MNRLARLALACGIPVVAVAQSAPPRSFPKPPASALGRFVALPDVERALDLRLRVFIPKAYTPTTSWPLIVYLHSSGEKGSDGEKPLASGLARVVQRQRETFPAIVLVPQARGGGARFVRLVRQSIDSVLQRYNVDRRRITITGVSFGGMAAANVALDIPDRIAGFVDIASAGCQWCEVRGQPEDSSYAAQARKLRAVPIWVIHGELDETVPTSRARLFVKWLKAVGAPVRYTEVKGGRHGVWDAAYADTAVINWMLHQHR